ncbi:MAG: 4-demethylwyosine synthase TYW1 [Candidatus Micrarchaeota archaeon]|nr:4-demethylwyosine synthase TYW1 [Candidatus Micrarchaeota archaeon]
MNPLQPLLLRQQYHLVGEHSAVKACKWLKESLVRGRECYKAKFYGINSHRCLQCTPSLQFCSQACLFCWRVIPDSEPTRIPASDYEWDEPEKIAEGFLREQLRIVSGYGGNSSVEKKKWEESKKPAHAAISLAGEPTIYPYLAGLISEFGKREMTTFLVSNGNFPSALETLSPHSLPTQLYLSMVAPDKKTHEKICRPCLSDAWERFTRSLEFMKSAKTRTVLRMTLARSLNFFDAEGYAKQIALAEPDYVEVKSFMFVGGSRNDRGLCLSDMPRHNEISEFASKLSGLTNYVIADEHEPSRVVLLCKDEKAEKARMIKR